MTFWTSIRTTMAQPAQALVLADIAGAGPEPGEPAAPLPPHQGYVRLWMSQMFLARKSTLLASWVPAAHSRVAISAAGRRTHEFGRVLRPDPEELSDGVRLNFALTDLVPYEGGDVEVDAALLGLQAGNNLDVAVDLLSMVSKLPVPGLDVATKISEGARDLVARGNGAVHLNLHQTFVATGPALVRPHYLALVLATHSEVAPADLRVVGDRLHLLTGGKLEPLTGFDFLLVRMECVAERPDYWLPEIEDAWSAAVRAYWEADTPAAEGYQRAARAAALRSPLLSRVDRRRVIEAIADQWSELTGRAYGATAEGLPADLSELMRQWAPSAATAANRGPITATEAFSR